MDTVVVVLVVVAVVVVLVVGSAARAVVDAAAVAVGGEARWCGVHHTGGDPAVVGAAEWGSPPRCATRDGHAVASMVMGVVVVLFRRLLWLDHHHAHY